MKKMIVLTGTPTLLSGCGIWHKPVPAPETLHYQCGTLPLTVTLETRSSR